MTAAPGVGPQVFKAISRITASFARAGIAKSHMNIEDQYLYRSIDDVQRRLAPLLAKHGLCVLPRVVRRESVDCTGFGDLALRSVRLLVAFDLVSTRDGSRHRVSGWGEALDPSDKGTAKAMSAAYKSAMIHLFCIPSNSDDPERESLKLKRTTVEREPPQGWEAWAADIVELVGGCETLDAMNRVRMRQKALLEALQRERPDLHKSVGRAFAQRSHDVTRGPGSNEKAAPALDDRVSRVASPSTLPSISECSDG